MTKSPCLTGRPQFATRQAANQTLGRLRRTKSTRHREQHHYLCPWCLQYHLSRRRQRRRRRRQQHDHSS